MALNIDRELRRLRQMTVRELKEQYVEVFGEETRSCHKTFLVKRIAWRMQANEYGGLSERARRRAEELADDADLRIRAPKGFASEQGQQVPDAPHERTTTRTFKPSRDSRLPMPGTVLTREYNGSTVAVMVLADGFQHEGQVYRSLTAVARAVTGAHWNGFHFFGLGKGKGGK